MDGISNMSPEEMFEKNYSECAVCKKAYPKNEMSFTRDCHGIPYRHACPSCYSKVMAKGYDGEYYSESDECIDVDY